MSAAARKDEAWVEVLDETKLLSRSDQPGRWKCYVSPAATNLGMTVEMGELPADACLDVGVHALPETRYILGGSGRACWEVNDRDVSADLTPGRIFSTLPHIRHTLKNVGRAPLRWISFRIEPPTPSLALASTGENPAVVATLNAADLLPVAGINGRWTRYVKPTLNNFGMVVGLGELGPAVRMTYHAHPEPEVFTVIAGCGRAYWQINGYERIADLQPGSMFYKIGQVPHDMECTGAAPMLGLAFKVQRQ